MWLVADSERDGRVHKGPVRETVVSRPLAGRRAAAVLLLCAGAASAVAATLWLPAEMKAGDGSSVSQPGFHSWLQSDSRRDHAGLSTLVVAGENQFLFDCGLSENEPVAQIVNAVRAVFLTHVDEATTSGFEWLLESPRARVEPEFPLRVWGPRGTKEWMRRRFGHPLAGGAPRRQFTVTELEEGPVAERDGVLVLAIGVSDGHLAYVVTEPGGHSMLIATDVPSSRRLAGLSGNVDVAIVRHTNERVAAEFFDRIRPRLAVLAPDGIPATAGGIRETYRGALQIVAPRPQRIDVPGRHVHPEG